MAFGYWKLASDRHSRTDKIADARWVLGYDIKVENANALERSLRLPVGRWDQSRVLELDAIHTLLGKVQGSICKERRKRSAGGSLRYYKRELLVSGMARLHGIRRAGPIQQQEQ
jgi:hypothetical protein